MAIICLEGMSAVGKTTTANQIAKNMGTYIIPEVNLLFERPKKETKTWYFERQIERWQIAKTKLQSYDTVILDGDVFQPLSYNWCFHFQLFNQSLSFIYHFYKEAVDTGEIDFPDKYVYLYASEAQLKSRKEKDDTTIRRNFDRHLNILEPHQRYYRALNNFEPDYAQMLEANNIQENVNQILSGRPFSSVRIDSRKLLDKIYSWLYLNMA